MVTILGERGPVGSKTGPEDPQGVKRYQLVVPNRLYARVQQAAEERDVSVVQLLRAFIKVGLLVLEAEKDPDSALILRTKDSEKQLVVV